MKIESLVDCRNVLGEGPIWDVQEERLYWVDIFGQKIFRATASGTEVESWPLSSQVGAMALRKGGGAIVSLTEGAGLFDFGTGECEVFWKADHAQPKMRVNDGKVDKRGRYLTGSIDVSETAPDGVLYSIGADLSVREIDRGVVVSNGPCWSPDGRTFYFSDSRGRTIWAYDYDLETGDLSNKRAFAQLGDEDGLPDGATVDAEGYVWSAGVYRGKIHRFAPDGKRDMVIDFPVVCVTSMAFGGPDLDILYVTTMKESPFPDVTETGPEAGNLFTITGLGIKGVPETRFAG